MAADPTTPDNAAARIAQAERALSRLPRDDLEALLLACARSFAQLARIAGAAGPEQVQAARERTPEEFAALDSEAMVALLAPMAAIGSLVREEHGKGKSRNRRIWNVARF